MSKDKNELQEEVIRFVKQLNVTVLHSKVEKAILECIGQFSKGNIKKSDILKTYPIMEETCLSDIQ
jgi:hypothetical protein